MIVLDNFRNICMMLRQICACVLVTCNNFATIPYIECNNENRAIREGRLQGDVIAVSAKAFF